MLVFSSWLIQGQVGRKRYYTKAMPSRGRPSQAWVEVFSEYLADELDRLMDIRVKICRSILWEIAAVAVAEPTFPFETKNGIDYVTKKL